MEDRSVLYTYIDRRASVDDDDRIVLLRGEGLDELVCLSIQLRIIKDYVYTCRSSGRPVLANRQCGGPLVQGDCGQPRVAEDYRGD